MGMPAAMAQMLSISDNNVPGTFRTPQWNVGVYHESHINIFDRLTLTLGLRYDYQKVSIEYATQSMFTLTGKGTMMMPGQGGQMIQIPVDFTSKFVSAELPGFGAAPPSRLRRRYREAGRPGAGDWS